MNYYNVKWKYLLIVLAFSLIISGCESGPPELSREMAADMIITKNKFPKEDIINVTTTLVRPGDVSKEKWYVGMVRRWQSTGLADVTLTKHNGYGNRWKKNIIVSEINVKFIDEAEKYLRGEAKGETFGESKWNKYKKIVVKIIDFGEVTGIAYNDSKTSAVVEYSVISSPTPFNYFSSEYRWEYKWDKFDFDKPFPKSTTSTKSERFQLYDDGWRIVR